MRAWSSLLLSERHFSFCRARLDPIMPLPWIRLLPSALSLPDIDPSTCAAVLFPGAMQRTEVVRSRIVERLVVSVQR